MKKKICILQNGLAWGGTDTFVLNLCRGIDKEKYDITVVNPSSIKIQKEDELKRLGITVIHTHPLEGFKGRCKHFYKLYKILRNGKYDIFQTNIDLFNGPNLLIAWMVRIPIRVCHSHNSLQGKELREGRSWPVRIYQSLTRWMCWNFSNRRVGCSEEANNFLFKGKNWKDANFPTVIFNGIELSKFRVPFDKAKFKTDNGVLAQQNIITIGHLVSQKNPLFIAQLFADFCKINVDCNLIWVGDGHLKGKVLEILKSNRIENRVLFLSNRNDIPQLLQISDVFILPSNFEGLGIVAIEAQAAGLPVLLSDKVPGLADCGNASFLPIDKGTVIWIEKIEESLTNTIRHGVSTEKLNRFGIENMVNQMTQLFES